MSIFSSRTSLAITMLFSTEPPTPMPSSPGGHQPAPSVSTVDTTQSATEAAGARLVNRDLFSEPPPLAATVTVTASPATISTWTTAGVLSPVLWRCPNGSLTIEARRGLSGCV